ncbi:helix-turn-helix domain-containing protein [Pseudomonas tremae]|uniref:helix-turn-helix domain-containing protein n=1 Tax=Pseudomonas tremae TaxID=200454 RepID=UPI0003F58A23|nr:helix-turn-helix domain-containing protein [Pseudomonas tremae]
MSKDTPRKFQGVWIPAERWLDRTLSPVEKVMLGEISSLETDARGCYATNAHFAEFFNLSISRVSEIISGLANRGLLDVELIRDGKRIVERRIRLVDPFDFPNTPSENGANPFGKDGEPPSENTQGNNTNINNTKNTKNPVRTGVENGSFDTFWKLYPRKVGKDKAERAWQKLKMTQDLYDLIVSALAKHVATPGWTKDNGQFIPHAATWLNGKRWEDEVEPAGNPRSGSRHIQLDQVDHTDGLELDDNGNYRIAGDGQ